MKRYPEYKEGGPEWIGEIPVHWEAKKLRYFCSMKSGNGFSHDLQGKTGLEVPFFKVSDTNTPENRVEMAYAQNTVSYQDVRNFKFTVHEPNSIVFPKIGVALLLNKRNILTKKSCIDNNMMALSSDQADHKFLYYAMLNVDFRRHYRAGTVPSINGWEVGDIRIAYPPHSEQFQIANFLDRKTEQIDELIHIKERMVELLQEQRTALVHETVTKGLDPNVEMKSSGVEWIGDIPKHWQMKRLKYVTEFIKNGTTATQIESGETDYPVTRIETISTGEINFDKVGYVNYWDGIENYRLRLGDILLSHINSLAMLGNCAMLEDSACLYHGMNLLRIRSNSLVDNRFLLYWLKSSPANQLIKSFAKFAIGQVSISITNLKEIPVGYPPPVEQTQIVNFLDHKTAKIDELRSNEQRSLELLKEYRQTLISEVVTGKLDVRSEV